MQDLQGRLSLVGLLTEESQKMKAALDQLQAKSAALQSENAVILENHNKLQSVASKAISFAQTVQKEAADLVHGLNAQHAQEREVSFHVACYLSIGQLSLCVVLLFGLGHECSSPQGIGCCV